MLNGEITKRMDTQHKLFEDRYATLFTKRSLQAALAEAEAVDMERSAESRVIYYSSLAQLRSMMQECGIPSEPGKSIAYYKRLIENADLPSGEEELESQIFLELLHHYRSFPAPEDFLLRIVEYNEKEENHWEGLPLRLRILRQFISECHGLTSVGYGGYSFCKETAKKATGKEKLTSLEIANALDDSVFDILKSAPAKEKKPKGKYGVIQLASDLGEATFRMKGKSRKELYLFAIAYRMSFFYGQPGLVQTPETDVEKLFYDWYNNNLLRFLNRENYEAKAGAIEVDPSGRAINWKNAGDMLFLYVLSRPGEPIHRLKQVKSLLKRVRDGAPKEPPLGTTSGTRAPATMVYRQRAMNGVNSFLAKDEDEFIQYLWAHYNCSGPDLFSQEDTQRAANKIYREACAELNALVKETGGNINYGLSIVDKPFFAAIDKEETSEEIKAYLRVLKRMDGLLRTVGDKGNVTRSKLLAAYYYIYNFTSTGTGPKNLAMVFEEFNALTQEKLIDAGYLPLNSKSLFDTILVFNAFVFVQ